MRRSVLVLCLLLATGASEDCAAFQASLTDTPQASQTQAPSDKRTTLWIIPHTHWEGAVFKTREAYLQEDLPNILQALHLLRTFPDYRFVLDQAAYVKPFLERYPEEAAEFRSLVSQGRLEIVGGNDVMLDVNIPSGESWIRQVLYGKGYYRHALNVDVTTGWAIDTFGHHAQMPQLLKLAGYKSYWFQRGVPGNQTPSEFLWQGIDGTRIPAFWLAQGYGSILPRGQNASMHFRMKYGGLWEALGGSTGFPERVAVAGGRRDLARTKIAGVGERVQCAGELGSHVAFWCANRFRTIGGPARRSACDRGRIEPRLPGHLQQSNRTEAVDARGRADPGGLQRKQVRWRRYSDARMSQDKLWRRGSPSSSIRRTTLHPEP